MSLIIVAHPFQNYDTRNADYHGQTSLQLSTTSSACFIVYYVSTIF